MKTAENKSSILQLIERKLIDNTPKTDADFVNMKEADQLVSLLTSEFSHLLDLAHAVRLKYCGDGVDLESLVSAKTGGCIEDCAFCSQSIHFETDIKRHPLFKPGKILELAKASEAAGAQQYCIVVAVRGPDEPLMKRVLEAVDLIHAETNLKVDCSLGLLTEDQAQRLKDAKVNHYNHNLESAESFFPNICTTHSWQDRADTCRTVRKVGMGLCSGGIFGMGESWQQRLELAFSLRELGVEEVPLNFLDARPGTPMAQKTPLGPMDALRICAIYRLILPKIILRYGGGRELILRDLQAFGLRGGVNAMVIGNYLTTEGRQATDDLQLLKDLGMPVAQL